MPGQQGHLARDDSELRPARGPGRGRIRSLVRKLAEDIIHGSSEVDLDRVAGDRVEDEDRRLVAGVEALLGAPGDLGEIAARDERAAGEGDDG